MPSLNRARFEQLDGHDPLAPLREAFVTVDGEIYLDGNSLGLLPRAVLPAVDQALRDGWARRGIRAWLEQDWIHLPQRIGARIARLIGADADEVIVADSTSINLFKAAAAARALRGDMISSQGRASVAPTPRRKLRREREGLGMELRTKRTGWGYHGNDQ